MKKWCILMLMTALAVGARAMETMITCEKTADHVGVYLEWTASPSMAYRIYGRPDMVGDWSNFTYGVTLAGMFETNLTNAHYFFRVEEFSIASAIEGMVQIPAGSAQGMNPLLPTESYSITNYPEFYSLTVDAFLMDATEVTKEAWDEVALWGAAHGYPTLTNTTAFSKAVGHPVVNMRWLDCILYCNARSERAGLTPCYRNEDGTVFRTYNYVTSFSIECESQAAGFRLPTGEEWEYAARDEGDDLRFSWGNTVSHEHANYYGANYAFEYDLSAGNHPDYRSIDDVILPYTAPVGDLPVSKYGLYNMLGNVREFTDPAIPVTADSVSGLLELRGGSWFDDGNILRCGHRVIQTSAFFADIKTGFRTVLSCH